MDQRIADRPALVAALGRAEGAVRAAFAARFRNPATGGLFDVDADHVPGKTDARIRPNQIVAVGGLPYPVLDGAAARGVVDLVEAKLLTPLGLRSLAREDPDYVPRYRRTTGTRCGLSPGHGLALADWPVCGGVAASARQFADSEVEARARFLPPLLRHLKTADSAMSRK